MKAQNEAQSMEHMGIQFASEGGLLSGKFTEWTATKVEAMAAIYADWLQNTPPESVPFGMLDLGIGDMKYLTDWDGFGGIRYTGVDGCEPVVNAARAAHPDLCFIHETFGQFLEPPCVPAMFPIDLVAAVDVLYHIPEDAVHDRVVDYVLGSRGRHRYALVTRAAKVVPTAGGAGPGTGGFSWFPRELPIPEHWDVLHQATGHAGSVNQELFALVRR